MAENHHKGPSLGNQVLADLHGCDPQLINDVRRVETVLREAARLAGATVIQGLFHRFEPQGVSGSLVLAESHLAIHTWPEHAVVSLDLFTCGTTVEPHKAILYCEQAFAADRCESQTFERGQGFQSKIGNAKP